MADIFMENEMYKPMRGYEGKYQITSLGRVYSQKSHMFLAGCMRSGYLQITAYNMGKRQQLFIHRLVAEHFLERPEVEDGEELHIDHRDKIKTNNAVWNLRWCSRRQNNLNRGVMRNNTSGFIGVSWDKERNKWRSQASVDGKNKCLGLFDCAEIGARVYDTALWFTSPPEDREFIQLNFQDYDFINENTDDDTDSIDTNNTENSDEAHTDPLAFGGYDRFTGKS